MEIKKVPISKVEVWEKNPRNIKTKDFERLKKQIQELGVYKPLICFRENGKYITLGGNMRLRALRELKHQDIDVSIIKAETEAMKIKYALSDNDRVGIYMEQELAELVYPYLEEIDLEDFKVDVGEPIELKDVIEDYAPNLDGTEDEVPEIDDSPAITKMGDLFQLGRHRLLCGDATKEEDVKRLMGGKKADMVFTDPPYGCTDLEWDRYPNNNDLKIWMSITDGAIAVFGAALPRCVKALLSLDPSPERIYVWWNTFTLTHSENAFWQWQPIYVWRKNRFKDIEKDVIQMAANTGGDKHKHPTQKPVALFQKFISPNEGKSICDLFLGSGTTLIACEKLNRICYGCEIEPKYCDVIITRYANFMGIQEEEIRATRE